MRTIAWSGMMKCSRINTLLMVAGSFASAVSAPGFAASATNTITIETKEITRPDVALGRTKLAPCSKRHIGTLWRTWIGSTRKAMKIVAML